MPSPILSSTRSFLLAATLPFLPVPASVAESAAPTTPVRIEIPGPVEAARILARPELPGELETALLAQSIVLARRLPQSEIPAFLEAVEALETRHGSVVPTPESPVVPDDDPLRAAILLARHILNQRLPAAAVPTLEASADYPGPVPPDTPRITRTLTVDGHYRGWLPGRTNGHYSAEELRPTGLYAAPGEVITVTCPVSAVSKGLDVVIGSYRLDLSKQKRWTRFPGLQRSFPLLTPVTPAANGLGGPIYISIPRLVKLGPLQITIEGAVEAPLYRLGETSPEAWRDEIRTRPAPWAELASPRIILTLPSSLIRDLDDPAPMLEFWGRALDTAAELAGVDRTPYRAERLVFDRQLHDGFMHSGYPIAAHLPSAEFALHPDRFASNPQAAWPFFHEIGHNHQQNLWHLPGSTEASCNLWAVYLLETLFDTPREAMHPQLNAFTREQTRRQYLNGDRNYREDWNSWVAFESYLQIQEAFGWDAYRRIFKAYDALEVWDMPVTDQRRIDTWLVQSSRACRRNLVSFYQSWGFPVSAYAKAEISNFRTWKP